MRAAAKLSGGNDAKLEARNDGASDANTHLPPPMFAGVAAPINSDVDGNYLSDRVEQDVPPQVLPLYPQAGQVGSRHDDGKASLVVNPKGSDAGAATKATSEIKQASVRASSTSSRSSASMHLEAVEGDPPAEGSDDEEHASIGVAGLSRAAADPNQAASLWRDELEISTWDKLRASIVSQVIHHHHRVALSFICCHLGHVAPSLRPRQRCLTKIDVSHTTCPSPAGARRSQRKHTFAGGKF